MIELREARSDEAAALSELCFRSKQSNGYDDAFMEACREELTVGEERLQRGDFWVAVEGTICGCACLDIDPDGTSGEVHAFFIDPDWQRKGVGRLLWQKLVDRATSEGLVSLYLDADPFAVPFYKALGFKTAGEASSGSIPGRHITHMTFALGLD